MKVEITVDRITRVFTGEYEGLHVQDWNRIIQEQLDDAKKYEDLDNNQ